MCMNVSCALLVVMARLVHLVYGQFMLVFFQINGYYCIAVVKVLVLLCIILCLAAMKGT